MLGNLRALFSVIFDIALLRRGPESLPASTALMACAIALNGAASALVVSVVPNASRAWPLQLVVTTIVTLACFHFALRFVQKRERFTQTITAYFGLGGLFVIALFPMVGALAPYAANPDPEAPPPFALSILFTLVWVWMVVVQVRIIRAAFDWPYVFSIAFYIGLQLASFVALLLLFGASPRPT
jgi:hypothetical protein